LHGDVPSPSSLDRALAFLAARAVPGIEDATPGAYRRTLSLPRGPAVIELGAPGIRAVVADACDRAGAEAAARRMLGSEDVAAAADAVLGADPVLAPLVARRPHLRVPGTADGPELAIRAVLGQQVSLAAARTLAGRLVAVAGDRLAGADGALTHLWPAPAAVADAAGSLPLPRARRGAVAAVARALADGGLRLEPGADAAAVRARLLELPGIGPWTAEYVALRALGDPDAWLPTDLGVRRGLARLGIGPEAADAWRPYRAHAVAHLWAVASGDHIATGRERRR
jgi:AraC family transcriptional regulator of adaptative response / DNA-3-methyladenine glycosylase II